jgi:hypothetical protein
MSEGSSGQSSRGDGGEIATSTLAEIYAQQGLLGRALSIYRRMLARAPGDSTIADRIRSLEVRMEEAGPEPRPPAPVPPAGRERLPWDPPEITGSQESGEGPGGIGAGEAAAPDAPGPPSPTTPAPAEPRPSARMDGEAFRSWLNAR